MEHPLATFASPALITGDKSRVSVAFHELTHSWFGNDVGCENWNNLWLNEGLNTFMARKIVALLRGVNASKVDYYISNTTMYLDMLDYGLNNSYSSLFPDIREDDPENSFSSVAYDKGAQFAYYIETLLGEEMMQTLLRHYLATFTQSAVNATDFKILYEDFCVGSF
jgi:leukotriene-A4 hydrolase